MKRVLAIVLGLGAAGAGAASASAQVIIGGSEPSVVVNWSVLDKLGPEPTLPSLLLPSARTAQTQGGPQAGAASGSGVAFKPYKPAKPAKQAKKVAQTRSAKKAVQPAAAKAPSPSSAPVIAELAQAARSAEPAKPVPVKAEAPKVETPKPEVAKAEAPKVETPKPEVAKAEAPKVAGPKIELPSTVAAPAKVEPAPAVVTAKVEPPPPVAAVAKAVEVTKAEAVVPPPPAPKPEPVLAAAAMATPALTPPPMPVPAPPPQLASLPSAVAVDLPPAPGGDLLKNDTLSVLFPAEKADLPGEAHSQLSQLARMMEKDEGLSLQLLAYASGNEANASKARRLSLSRALEVRKFLLERGVRSTRIEVRALGNKAEGGPADRVDAVLLAR